MTIHTCTRCGHEVGCSHGTWSDRHPAAAVAFAVPVFIVSLGAIAAYPAPFLPLLAIGSVVYLVERKRRRAEALAARADHEHAALLAGPIPPVRPLPVRHPHSLPWQLIKLLRTEPLRISTRAKQ